jgi:hypothetical protein
MQNILLVSATFSIIGTPLYVWTHCLSFGALLWPWQFARHDSSQMKYTRNLSLIVM